MSTGSRIARGAGWALAVAVSVASAAAGSDGGDAEGLPRLARHLRAHGYAVRESLPGDARTVLVLSDVHDRAITGATLAGLDSLGSAFRFDVVGLENQDHDFRNLRREGAPPGPVIARLESLLAAVDPALRDWAKAIVRRRHPSGASATLAEFVDRHPGIAFGLEGSDSAMLFVRVAAIHGELLLDRRRAVLDSVRAFDPGSPEHRMQVRGLEALDRFLGAADPTFQRWPPAFEWGPDAVRRLDGLLGTHAGWLNQYIGDGRNRTFTHEVTEELARRARSRAVVVVGYAHTARSRSWPSLQERLRDSGATVIVADPPAVREWLARNPWATSSR